MTKNILTYNEFQDYINDIIRIRKLEESIINVCVKYNRDDIQLGYAEFQFPTLENDLVNLLMTATHDENEWIDYWLYELDCGQNYEIGKITIDNKPVALQTIQDLWDLINGTPHYEESQQKG